MGQSTMASQPQPSQDSSSHISVLLAVTFRPGWMGGPWQLRAAWGLGYGVWKAPSPHVNWGGLLAVAWRMWGEDKWLRKEWLWKESCQNRENVHSSVSQAQPLYHWGNGLACDMRAGVLGPSLPQWDLLEQNTEVLGKVWTLGSDGLTLCWATWPSASVEPLCGSVSISDVLISWINAGWMLVAHTQGFGSEKVLSK